MSPASCLSAAAMAARLLALTSFSCAMADSIRALFAFVAAGAFALPLPLAAPVELPSGALVAMASRLDFTPSRSCDRSPVFRLNICEPSSSALPACVTASRTEWSRLRWSRRISRSAASTSALRRARAWTRAEAKPVLGGSSSASTDLAAACACCSAETLPSSCAAKRCTALPRMLASLESISVYWPRSFCTAFSWCLSAKASCRCDVAIIALSCCGTADTSFLPPRSPSFGAW
mmetsp:Transcript_23313/g.59506  ORF Transcript_23313/g.59506 Transcript_23313/m.59506 type:complete len:234 (-) Transcript_23313:115-816(-)